MHEPSKHFCFRCSLMPKLHCTNWLIDTIHVQWLHEVYRAWFCLKYSASNTVISGGSHHCVKLPSIMLSWQYILLLSFRVRHYRIINRGSSASGGQNPPDFFLGFHPWTLLRDFRPHSPCDDPPFSNPGSAPGYVDFLLKIYLHVHFHERFEIWYEICASPVHSDSTCSCHVTETWSRHGRWVDTGHLSVEHGSAVHNNSLLTFVCCTVCPPRTRHSPWLYFIQKYRYLDNSPEINAN